MTRSALALVLSAAALCRAERPAEFAFAAEIQAQGDAALYRIALPPTLYERVARGDLSDVRVFNAAGQLVPYALEPRAPAGKQPGATANLPVFPIYGTRGSRVDGLDIRIERSASGTIARVTSPGAHTSSKEVVAWLIDASRFEHPLFELELDWRSDLEGLAGRVRVEASEDLANWVVLATEAPLVNLEFGGHRVEQKTVPLRSGAHKYLRLSWPSGQPPIELTHVRVRSSDRTVEPERDWRSVQPERDAGRAGEYRFDLGGQFPLDRVRVVLPEDNTVVAAELSSRASADAEWAPVTRAIVYRLRQGAEALRNPDLEVHIRRDRYWRLRIDPKGGGIGRGEPTLEIGWVPEALVFAARGGGPYQLAYGRADAKTAALAIRSLVPGWGTQSQIEIAEAQVGPARTLAGANALRGNRDLTKWGLWLALGVGVALLSWMAWRLTRELRAAPEADATRQPPT